MELPVSVCYYLTTGMSINNEAAGVYVGVTAGVYHQAELSDLCWPTRDAEGVVSHTNGHVFPSWW